MKKSDHHLEPGKLYATQEWFWLVFPSQEKVATVAFAVVTRRAAAYWSERLKCTVTYVDPGSVFMVLSVSGKFLEVLFAETLGWIWVPEWAENNVQPLQCAPIDKNR